MWVIVWRLKLFERLERKEQPATAQRNFMRSDGRQLSASSALASAGAHTSPLRS